MNILDAIDNRKTVRKFDSKKPTTDEIKRMIDSARLAPSAINAQNWKFIAVLNDDIKNQMAESVIEAYDKIISNLDKETAAGVERFKGHSTFFTHAPLVIVCIEEDAPSFMGGILEQAKFTLDEIKLMRPDSYLLSMGGAIENILLTAFSQGYGSCWMVAPILGEKGMRKILKLKDNQKIVSILSIGKPAADATDKRSPKKELKDIIEIVE